MSLPQVCESGVNKYFHKRTGTQDFNTWWDSRLSFLFSVSVASFWYQWIHNAIKRTRKVPDQVYMCIYMYGNHATTPNRNWGREYLTKCTMYMITCKVMFLQHTLAKPSPRRINDCITINRTVNTDEETKIIPLWTGRKWECLFPKLYVTFHH